MHMIWDCGIKSTTGRKNSNHLALSRVESLRHYVKIFKQSPHRSWSNSANTRPKLIQTTKERILLPLLGAPNGSYPPCYIQVPYYIAINKASCHVNIYIPVQVNTQTQYLPPLFFFFFFFPLLPESISAYGVCRQRRVQRREQKKSIDQEEHTISTRTSDVHIIIRRKPPTANQSTCLYSVPPAVRAQVGAVLFVHIYFYVQYVRVRVYLYVLYILGYPPMHILRA